MKRTISLFMGIAFAALMAVSGNVLASEDQEIITEEVVEQGQQVVQEEMEVTEESVTEVEEMHQEGEQAVETMQDEAKEMATEGEE